MLHGTGLEFPTAGGVEAGEPAVPSPVTLDDGLFTYKKNPGEGKCCVRGCRNDAKSSRKKSGDRWYCAKHWQQRWRLKSPKRSAYRTLADHAKARGIKFTLTYDYYCGMMDVVGYWDHKAESRGEVLSIDRVDATKGYEPGNVRVVSISLNSSKGNRERFLPAHVQAVLERKRAKAAEKLEEPADCPF